MRTKVEVGYIKSKDHWMSDIPVAQVASNLHYWSPWRDSFMLSPSKKSQVQKIVTTNLLKLGSVDLIHISSRIGSMAKDQIEVNIKSVTSPANSGEWSAVKGFNDPLIFGSRVGNVPNLLSELTFKVGL